jgi:hypothetical protein
LRTRWRVVEATRGTPESAALPGTAAAEDARMR